MARAFKPNLRSINARLPPFRGAFNDHEDSGARLAAETNVDATLRKPALAPRAALSHFLCSSIAIEWTVLTVTLIPGKPDVFPRSAYNGLGTYVCANPQCTDEGAARDATLVPFRRIGLNARDVASSCRHIQPTSKQGFARCSL